MAETSLKRICSKCGDEKESTEFHVGRRECKPCKKIYDSDYHRAKKLENPGKIRARDKAWRDSNKDKIKGYNDSWYINHTEDKKARARVWYEANKDRAKMGMKAWREANPEKTKIAQKSWKKANPEKWKISLRISNHKRRSILRNLQSDLTVEEWLEIWAEFEGLCFWCGAIAATIDHLIPLTPRKNGLQGYNTKRNVVPACKSCNSKKNNKDPLVFLFELLAKQELETSS